MGSAVAFAAGLWLLFALPVHAQQSEMTPAQRAAQEKAMENKFLPVCIDYYKTQLKKAGHNPSADRFHRSQYLRHCLQSMKDKARKREQERLKEQLRQQKPPAAAARQEEKAVAPEDAADDETMEDPQWLEDEQPDEVETHDGE